MTSGGALPRPRYSAALLSTCARTPDTASVISVHYRQCVNERFGSDDNGLPPLNENPTNLIRRPRALFFPKSVAYMQQRALRLI
jgi:hypothetical protein